MKSIQRASGGGLSDNIAAGVVGERIRNQAAQEGDALDQLGCALHQQQGHADRQQKINRPANESPRVLRHLSALPGLDEQRPGHLDQHPAEGRQEDDDARDVDP
jgi:hypothetical protein